MNSDLLLALGLALAVAALAVALLLRRRPRQGVPTRPAVAAPPPPPTLRPPPRAVPDAEQLVVQRQAATEALRLARQRKAEEAALQEAERAAQDRASAAARARPPQRVRAAAPAATVPARQPPAPATSLVAPGQPLLHTLAPQLAPLAAPVPRVLRPPLVLLADDSKVVRVKTGRLLQKQGWQVLLAEDGSAALQCLDSHAPDLLITDVEMPGLDGFELTRRLRAHPRFARLPVIMITSSDERHRAEADAAGVNLLLGKPYAEETLLAQVQALLAAAQPAGAGLALH